MLTYDVRLLKKKDKGGRVDGIKGNAKATTFIGHYLRLGSRTVRERLGQAATRDQGEEGNQRATIKIPESRAKARKARNLARKRPGQRGKASENVPGSGFRAPAEGERRKP